MFKVFNEMYYVDFDEIETYVNIASITGETQINVVKYELIKSMMDTILTETNEVDDNVGMVSNELTLPFKIAFNSLLLKKIIKKI